MEPLISCLHMRQTKFFISGIDNHLYFDYNKSVASEMQQLNMR